MSSVAGKDLGKLFHLKSWFEVSEAAKYLSSFLDEDVSRADIFRLALEGQLTLSVHFINHISGVGGRAIPAHEVKRTVVPTPDGKGTVQILRGTRIRGDKVIVWDDHGQNLAGRVWDLPMIGVEVDYVEAAYQRANCGPEVDLESLEDTFVSDGSDRYYKLVERFDSNEYPNLGKDVPFNSATNYHPYDGLPSDCVFVVKRTSIHELVERLGTQEDSLGKPLQQRERTTLLVLIAALAKLAKVDVSKPSSAAAAIETQTALMGARVAARTIEGHLGRIDEALESRGTR